MYAVQVRIQGLRMEIRCGWSNCYLCRALLVNCLHHVPFSSAWKWFFIGLNFVLADIKTIVDETAVERTCTHWLYWSQLFRCTRWNKDCDRCRDLYVASVPTRPILFTTLFCTRWFAGPKLWTGPHKQNQQLGYYKTTSTQSVASWHIHHLHCYWLQQSDCCAAAIWSVNCTLLHQSDIPQ